MIDFSGMKKLFIGGVELKQLFINGTQVWKAGYKNWVPYSIDTDGSIFNGGLGYKEGYRLSSSGALKTQDGSVATGFIPAKPGEVVRMAGVEWGTTVTDGYVYIAYFDSNFSVVDTVNRYMRKGTNGISGDSKGTTDTAKSSVVTDGNGVTTFNIVFKTSVEYSYVRISAAGNGVDMIVTVNEEIA